MLEWVWVQQFLAQVNEGGLRFASGNESVVSTQAGKSLAAEFMKKYGNGSDCSRGWPPLDLLPNFALAQHHGIPTRLLDWTELSYIAMYFSAVKAAAFARDAEEKPINWTHFSIWALNRAYLYMFEVMENAFAHVVTLPRAANPNLHAQSGLFVHYWEDVPASPGAVFKPFQFDDVVVRAPAGLRVAPNAVINLPSPALIRVDVPGHLAGPVLRELALLGVSASRLFPGYDGAARAVQESYLW